MFLTLDEIYYQDQLSLMQMEHQMDLLTLDTETRMYLSESEDQIVAITEGFFESVKDFIVSIFKAIGNFFKSIWNAIFGGKAGLNEKNKQIEEQKRELERKFTIVGDRYKGKKIPVKLFVNLPKVNASIAPFSNTMSSCLSGNAYKTAINKLTFAINDGRMDALDADTLALGNIDLKEKTSNAVKMAVGDEFYGVIKNRVDAVLHMLDGDAFKKNIAGALNRINGAISDALKATKKEELSFEDFKTKATEFMNKKFPTASSVKADTERVVKESEEVKKMAEKIPTDYSKVKKEDQESIKKAFGTIKKAASYYHMFISSFAHFFVNNINLILNYQRAQLAVFNKILGINKGEKKEESTEDKK